MGQLRAVSFQDYHATKISAAALLDNRLYEQNFFAGKLPGLLPEIPGLDDSFNFCLNLFKAHPDLDNYHENQLEDEIIKPVLTALGWSILPQEVKITSGAQQKIDLTLFADQQKFLKHQEQPPDKRYANFEGISVLVRVQKIITAA